MKQPSSSRLVQLASSHHIASFDFMAQTGLNRIVTRLSPCELTYADMPAGLTPPFSKLRLSIENLRIGRPYRKGYGASAPYIHPTECRIAGKTYSAPLFARVRRLVDSVEDSFEVYLGEVPIMIGSTHCHLSGLNAKGLIGLNEDPNEFGGYFIVNGLYKVVRMLIVQKRNYPVAFLRPSYIARGPGYTQYAVQMRCVRDDFYAKTFTLHYLADGNIALRLLFRKQEFLVPVAIILRSFGMFTDREIFQRLLGSYKTTSDRAQKVEALLRVPQYLGLVNRTDCLSYLGKSFRLLFGLGANYSDSEAGYVFCAEAVCPHINDPLEKLNTLSLAIDKLYSLVEGRLQPENLDSLAVHEVLLPGHLYQMLLREKLYEALSYVQIKLIKDMNASAKTPKKEPLGSVAYLKTALENSQVGKALEQFLSTGSLRSRSGLDLMQDKGFCVVADRLNNMRFLSHFRSVHRGAYFAELKTTIVRKLMPYSWGFLCPVHTPDGAPCGLLNHIALNCRPLAEDILEQFPSCDLTQICEYLGMLRLNQVGYSFGQHCYPVMVDGRYVGVVEDTDLNKFIQCLGQLKVEGKMIPAETEIAVFRRNPIKNVFYPMIFIATTPARFLRPVGIVDSPGTIEWISPLEQISLDIGTPGSKHCYLAKGTMLSVLPHHIPFLNYNQSPRNMYQCQMAKQTMGTAVLNWDFRADNKLYRLLQSQRPLVRTRLYEDLHFDDYNSGTNAVVAVLSYTGYDMEDAMIMSKTSFEAGLGHGCVYKTLEYSLERDYAKKTSKYRLFQYAPLDQQKAYHLPPGLQADGLIAVGSKLKRYAPVAAFYEVGKRTFKVFFSKYSEGCTVDSVILVGGERAAYKVLVKVRFDRRPIIGDKFSSRHGQKGVLSVLWPKADMPFTYSGMTPDIIINPNAFPSRMTIGMLIESMAAKAAALEGTLCQYDVFQEYEGGSAADYFGRRLHQHGFNYHGNEVMYSGLHGAQLKVDIYLGLVYYQRLRHMVSDKSQARTTGPVDALTQQPLKGRKKGGGIRMGEMERDAMLAHGFSQVVSYRFLRSSDKAQGHICRQCGLMLPCFRRAVKVSGYWVQEVFQEQVQCNHCAGKYVSAVAIPFVLRYMLNELAALNIRIRFKLSD